MVSTSHSQVTCKMKISLCSHTLKLNVHLGKKIKHTWFMSLRLSKNTTFLFHHNNMHFLTHIMIVLLPNIHCIYHLHMLAQITLLKSYLVANQCIVHLTGTVRCITKKFRKKLYISQIKDSLGQVHPLLVLLFFWFKRKIIHFACASTTVH